MECPLKLTARYLTRRGGTTIFSMLRRHRYALRLGPTGFTFFDDGVINFVSPYAAGKSAIFLVALGKGRETTLRNHSQLSALRGLILAFSGERMSGRHRRRLLSHGTRPTAFRDESCSSRN
jgi:hypothetical protein